MAQIRNRPELDQVLASAKNCNNFVERADWLVQLFAWIRKGSFAPDADHNPNRLPTVRLKFLLSILDRNAEWKENFIKNVRQLLSEVEATDSLTAVGLGNQVGFLQELSERIIGKFLPSTPLKQDFSSLIGELFPSESDLEWLLALDEEIIEKLIALFRTDSSDDENLARRLASQTLDAKSFLISQIRSFGLSSAFRERTKNPAIRTSPYFYLIELDTHLHLEKGHESLSFDQLIEECEAHLREVNQYLDRHGISISLIFQMERTHRQIQRLKILQSLIESGSRKTSSIKLLMADMVRTTLSNQSVLQLFQDNYELLTQKVVDRNSEVGSHYMATTKKDTLKMFKKAAGGGLITSLTVCFKSLIALLPIAPFMMGFAQAINYSASFVLIQSLGFTLATKQPASTAAAIASKIEGAEKSDYLILVESIFAILRAQIISVVGNLALVAPAVFILSYLYTLVSGRNFLTMAEAEYILGSTDILGACAIYGAFTGVLLFTSSIFAGWVDNWFTYRDVAERISLNLKIRNIFGVERAQKIARFLKENVTGLAANISLGFMLGLVPVILKFLGVPLDVRHVTLSTGSFTLALTNLEASLYQSEIVRAALGILVIGALNITVSFYLALKFALSAKKVNSHKRRLIYGHFFAALIAQPWRLFWPPRGGAKAGDLH